jgi:hypothetical protein
VHPLGARRTAAVGAAKMLAELALIGLAHSDEHKVCLRRDL